MQHGITSADLKGLLTPALDRIYAASRDAVVAAGGITADRFDALVRAFCGSEKPRDLALSALSFVSNLGGKVAEAVASPQTLAEGGFMGSDPVYTPGYGPALARQIIAAA